MIGYPILRRPGHPGKPCFWLLVCTGLGLPVGEPSAELAQAPMFIGACTDERAAGASLSLSWNSTLAAGALLVQSGFLTRTWEGYVKAYEAVSYLDFLAGRRDEPQPAWSARFPPASSRNVHTSTHRSASAPFEWCRLSDVQRTALDPAHAGASPCTASPPIVAYLRGDATHERRNGGPFRDRLRTVLGDVVNSVPLYSAADDHAYQLAPAASFSAWGTHGHQRYRAYVDSKKSERMPTVMFGANDGMFHILDGRTGQETSGLEIFAYVPRAVYGELRPLADAEYAHRYSVDGPVVEGDVWDGVAWKTITVASTGAGPAGLFAIDVSAPERGLGPSSVLWDIVPADHPAAEVREHLGHLIGAGIVGSVRHDRDGDPLTLPNGRWVYITGNGYESSSARAVLFIFDALDGSLIRALDTGAGTAGSKNGLGSVTAVYDGNRNIAAVYAGDRLGNLWKFDLGAPDPSRWKVFNRHAGGPAPLFVASDETAVRPIHQAPRVTPHPLGGVYVAFGTGKYFETEDRFSADDQGIFAIRDAGQVATVPFDALRPLRTEQYTSGSETYRRLAADDVAAFSGGDRGFWVRLRPGTLAADGERVIAPLSLDGGTLAVTTFAPGAADGACIAGGSSYLYRINLAGFRQGAFGTEGAGTVARRFAPGTVSAMLPAQLPGDHDGTVVRRMSGADLNALLSRHAYRMDGDQPVRQAPAGRCVHAGLSIDATVARIPTQCAGLMPLRSWRPMR